jgi:hypothetical protein
MKKEFRKAVLKAFESTKGQQTQILTEADIQHLPGAVKRYLLLTGVVGKEKIMNFRAEFSGGIRSGPGEKFMSLRSVQYNFMEDPTRLFHIVAKKMGIPAVGNHIYRDQKATMLIKILGLFIVSDAKGWQMDQGETVTVFNDMCFMAPASLIDKRIEWKEINAESVSARFTNGGISITATLFFNVKGELVNFISNDRFETVDGKNYYNYPWSTPVLSYTDINGYHLPSEAKLIYKHPDEDFCYGEFRLVSLEYNCRDYR